jgi:peptidoglycan glycosyltransferase
VSGRASTGWTLPPRLLAAGPWLRRLLVTAAVLYLALFAWTGTLAGWAEEAYWKDDLPGARSLLQRAAFWRVRAGRVHDALGVVLLAKDETARAEVHLARARRGFFHPAAFGAERVLADFLREGRLEAARRYAAHRMAVRQEPLLAFYLGVAEAALGRLNDAEGHLRAAAADTGLKEKADAHRALVAERRRTGRVDTVVDRRGTAVASLRPGTGRASLLSPDLAPLLLPAIDPLLKAGAAVRVQLALDLEFQRAAEAALGSRAGALVVMDVAGGGVLAAASRPRSGPGRLPLALSGRFEPGSIVKMITLEAALRRGVDVDGLFPMDCPGREAVDGVVFRDWMPHGRVSSIDEAVAVSCNLAFGRLGERVGREPLDEALRRFGFGDGEPAVSGADFRFASGQMLPDDAEHPRYALWRRAVGLDSLSITPMHAALIAAAMARGSSPPVPRLVARSFNVLGEDLAAESTALYAPEPLPRAARDTLRRVMQAAVRQPRGTARRAAVEGLTLAVKTGTSGDNPPGYDALVIGYAPAESPVIAWALVAQHAGKAEWEGARITRDFLRRVQGRLRAGAP